MVRQRELVFPYYYSPGKKTFHIVARMKDVPGAFSSVLELLKKHVNLISTVTYSTADNNALFSGVAEALSPAQTTESLRSAVRESPMVFESRVTEARNGFLVDSFHTGLRVGTGEPYMMIPTDSLSEMFGHIVKVFGSGGETILYEEGMNFGASRGNAFKDILGVGNITKMFEELTHIYSVLGYGLASIPPMAAGDLYRIRLADCFECSTPQVSRRGCSFMKGLITGFGTVVFTDRVHGEETKCRNRGDDACEFVLTKAE